MKFKIALCTSGTSNLVHAGMSVLDLGTAVSAR